MTKLSVLIVDDEMLERVLIRKGYDWAGNGFEIIGEVGSSQEALEFIASKRPDIILTDINMPNMDGLELTEKSMDIHPSARIVIITGYRDFEYARRALKLGVEDFLLKPLNIAEVGEVAAKIKEKIAQEEGRLSEVETLKKNIHVDQIIHKINYAHVPMDWTDFVFSVQNCLLEKAESYVESYVRSIEENGVLEAEYLQVMAMDMITKAGSTLRKQGQNLVDLMGEDVLYDSVREITDLEQIQPFLLSNLHTIMEANDRSRTKKNNKIIDQTLEYLNNNIFDPDLTLKSAAAHIYVNESYLSRVFKQETGEPLISYITRKRIEASIVLLNTTNLKVYEIARQVGIRDPHYFSICFKKQMGITVNEYRKPQYSKMEEE